MKIILNMFICVILAAGTLKATPFIADGGFITPQGKNDVKVNLFYNQYTGSYDNSGAYSSFAPGVTRLDYTLLFDLKYGTSRDADVQIILPYMNKLHTVAGGISFGAIGVGDLTVIGRQKSNENKSSGGMLTVGAGVKVPTGKSFFNVDQGSLATGTGTWDAGAVLNMQENNNGILLFTDVSYWYRFGLNIRKFAGYDISDIKAGETEVKFTPGTILKYNIGVEMPVIKQLSIVGELNGEVYYDNKAEYVSNNADAMSDLLLKGAPDFTLQKSVNHRLAAGVKIYLGDKVALGGGVSIPVSMVNSFGNMTYIIHCRLFF
ncbi:MAG: hypothetical protein A2452_04130 [Candidatus Firestonebacteria bacterium RIFOXYC2_FULL_39_67]|nr:MAG: hypothetical protein A2536_09015 [Candidatus Firestonebacteria bacterium RIFOXYD2_FULL_39_29]OGF56150.1 MAG: hypothetical protein A2452_04130 [Candidatus Firestonebacteria bacterium RIFOXYC2_FULL_39_67]